MDLRSFAAWYRSDKEAAALSQGEGHVLVGFFISRLVDEAESIGPDEWEGLADTLDRAMTLAGLDHDEWARRRLNLTLALVNRVGPSFEHALRNPDVAAAVFLDALPMQFAEASALLPDWSHASLDDMRRLTAVKDLLTPMVGVEGLISDGAAKDSVKEWMTLLPLLP